MSGKSLQKTILDSSEYIKTGWLSLLLVFGAGMLAVWFHEVLRWPLNLPGRHGLELMAILLFTRLSAPQQYAATLAAIGGVTASAVFHDSLGVGAVILLAQGLFIDSSYHLLKHSMLTLVLMVIATAFAHMLKPIIKLGFQLGLSVNSDSLIHGLAYPLLTHFMFGLLGGVAGLLGWRAMHKVKSQQ